LRWVPSQTNDAQLAFAEKLVTIPHVNHAIYHRSSEQIAQIYEGCLLLKKHKRSINLSGIDFQKIKNDVHSLSEIENIQKNLALRELVKFNSFFCIISSSALFYKLYKPVTIPIVFASLTCLTMCAIYYAKLVQMYNRRTNSEKMYYYLCELQKLQQDGSTV
jgi:hypothetical protein